MNFAGVEHFQDYSSTAFTLLQMLTLDDWGSIAKKLPTTSLTLLLVAAFITLLAMFFWFLI